ncbi:MAG TPA: sigma-54 dependent transcriptional regulator [Dongiaceae bacterium]|nr:sigma-54 dependent transcriptional regulator [Dongiaceae bacterium]
MNDYNPAVQAMPAETNQPEVQAIAVVMEDAAAFAELRRGLQPGLRATLADTEAAIKGAVEDSQVRALLLDLDVVGEGARDGVEVLQEIRAVRDDMVLVAMTRSRERSIPLSASQAGADEFVLWPVNYEELQEVIVRAIEKRALEMEGRRVVQQVENRAAFWSLIGASAAMQRLYQTIQAVAESNTTVVLRGESGTGKELIAKAIVQSSDRANEPYICLNCSALPESLIESELFGYEKGAFTGADAARAGLIESAQGGTLFLDEITTLNPGLQSKLLRVLQERTVQRLGGRAAKKIDFRLICATNDDLEDLVRKGQFREDLYYRINVVPIAVPPLRERDGDLPLLVDHFLRLYCAAAKKPVKSVQPEALEILEEYPWPGNVRELENLVQRLVVMTSGAVITAENLPSHLLQHSASGQEAILIPEEGVDFDAEMERIEIAYLTAALRRCGGKKSAAAALLRLDGQRMKYLCRKLKL